MNQLRINNLNIVALWNFNSNVVSNKTCSLCRNNLMAPTQTEIDKKNIKNTVVVGKCKHAYHESCMNKWLSDSNVSCVTCKTEWKPLKNSISTAVIKLKEFNNMPKLSNTDMNENEETIMVKKTVVSDSDDSVKKPVKKTVKAVVSDSDDSEEPVKKPVKAVKAISKKIGFDSESD